MKIKSIQKGVGDTAMWFRVGEKGIARIEEELKPIRMGEGTVYEMVVYRAYSEDGNRLIEWESGSGLMFFYME